MKIIFKNYKWKFIGIPKDPNSQYEEIEIFPHIASSIIDYLMEQLAWYNVEDYAELRTTQDYLKAKKVIQNQLKLTQENKIITINSLSKLTRIPEEKLTIFLNDINSEDFNTGELFSLSLILNKLV